MLGDICADCEERLSPSSLPSRTGCRRGIGRGKLHVKRPEIPRLEKKILKFFSLTGPAARVAEAWPPFPQPGGVELLPGAKFTSP